MADAIVEQRPLLRFFCHGCRVEFQDVEQDYICPYCDGGFIEQLEGDSEGEGSLSRDDYSDADMSNIEVDEMGLDDSDEFNVSGAPVLNDLAFLMSDGHIRSVPPSSNSSNAAATNSDTTLPPSGFPRRTISAQRQATLVEEMMWLIGGGRPPPGGGMAPLVLVGTPGDYVLGGEGLDAVVTQLLGQLEHSGPPPLPRDIVAALPTELNMKSHEADIAIARDQREIKVSEELAAANTACSVCWENFQIDETLTRLECEHFFHRTCITPWLELHATCPVCRRSLLPPGVASPEPPPRPAGTAGTTGTTGTASTAGTTGTARTTPTATTAETQRIRLRTPLSSIFVNTTPHIVISRRVGGIPTIVRRMPSQTHTWDSRDTSAGSPASSVSSGGVWAAQNRSSSNSGNSSNSSTSFNSDRDRQYHTDMDYD